MMTVDILVCPKCREPHPGSLWKLCAVCGTKLVTRTFTASDEYDPQPAEEMTIDEYQRVLEDCKRKYSERKQES